MKQLALGAVAAAVWWIASGSLSDAQPASDSRSFTATVALATAGAATATPVSVATLNEVVQRYCVVCHNDQLLTGNLTLRDFDVEAAEERAETAEKMIRKLRAGMMPPPGMPRPSADTLLALVETLEARVDESAQAAATPQLGERRFQRLTLSEYERVVADLLALDIDAGQWLPPDVLMGSFDNASGAQGLSAMLLDGYLRAAIEVTRLALGNPAAVSLSHTYKNPAEVSQHAWDHVEGTPFGTRGGMVVTHSFPADGEYVFQFETDRGSGNNIWFEDLDLSIDGEPVALLKLEHNGGDGGGRLFGDDAPEIPAVRTEPIFVGAGQRQVSAAFVDVVDGPYEDRFIPTMASYAGGSASRYGVTGLTHLNELVITGPTSVSGVSETESRRKILTCRPTSSADEQPCAQSILERLATKAYRRPLSEADVAGLMGFYDDGAAEGGFEAGVRNGLQAILASPEFLFRLERMPEGIATGESYRLGSVDLATRLSFFLWASSPDEELLDVATSGALTDPAVLGQQVQRMLEDPRSEALATRFAHQWLRLQDVGKNWPEAFFYPEFSTQLADAMVRETELLFDHLVRQDLSALELFTADYTFINERLAEHYRIEGVVGDHFRRVQYPSDQRRGILGHGGVLHLTSMANRTSPVLRGKWVMEVLMGTPPPPPPPNVPAFEASPSAGGGRRLTTRERMEMHRSAPVCSSCHNFIDPIGLALDNYDATGKWRIRENMAPLDTRGTFYDGTEISQPNDLVDVLMKRPIPLVRNVIEHMLAYALGRPVEYFDQPTIRAIQQAAEPGGYRMSSLIQGIAQSDVFQMKQTLTTAN